MKTLALKNPESVTADVVLEVVNGYQCDFCKESSKNQVAGHNVEYTDCVPYTYVGYGFNFGNNYTSYRRTFTPTICFDCIRQLAKLIPKQ